MPLIDLEEGGGGIQSFTGTISECYFTENDIGTSFMIKVLLDDPENYPSKEDGAYTLYVPCGPGWHGGSDGDTVVNDDTSRKFNKRYDMGRLCDALNAVPGIEDVVASDFSAYTAKSWKGLHLSWERRPINKMKPVRDTAGNDVIDPKTGRTMFEPNPDATQMLPVAVAGAASTNGQGVLPIDLATLGLDADQTAALVGIDATLPDAKFLEGVIGIPGLTSNSALMKEVTGNMAGLRASLAATGEVL